jgi:hypothetical protein
MAVRYTVEERIEMVLLFGDNARTAEQTGAEFHRRHPERTRPSNSSVLRLVKKFKATGSVMNTAHVWNEKPATGDAIKAAVLASYEVNPQQSTRHVAQEAAVSHQSVWKILKEENFHPYKIRLTQQLDAEDGDRRLQFCEWAIAQTDRNPDFGHHIIWSDEATFFLNGHVNRQGYRYWSKENPYWYEESHTQRPQKLNVWAGIWDDMIIGPYFINATLTSEKYHELLRDTVFPQIRGTLDVNEPWFQQDGAPPHFGTIVRDFLDETFPGKWIGRRGSVEWPPRSPDLTPCDYFLWGYLKSRVYANRPSTLQQLEDNIRNECEHIQTTPGMLENVLKSWKQRVRDCVVANGLQFEHKRK